MCVHMCVHVWWRRQKEGGVVASTVMAIDLMINEQSKPESNCHVSPLVTQWPVPSVVWFFLFLVSCGIRETHSSLSSYLC